MATVNLGNLGVEREPIDMEFGWFGQTIRVHPDASDMEFTAWLEDVAGVNFDPDDPADLDPSTGKDAVVALMRFMRGQIHPDDFDMFWKTAQAHRQTTLDLMAVSMRIVEAVSGFPTGQPSGSSHGPDGTPPRSPDVSRSAPDSRRDRAVTTALEYTKGRPDLQLAIVQAQEHRAAQKVAA
jgi:hypothetical protein